MIRLDPKDVALCLSVTGLIGCAKEPSGYEIDREPIDEFTDAACRCWELVDLGDVYFYSEADCLETAGAMAFGFPFNETECVVEALEELTSTEDDVDCHLAAMESSIACFEAIDVCGLDQYDAWNDCFIEGAGWATCAHLDFELVYPEISECSSFE